MSDRVESRTEQTAPERHRGVGTRRHGTPGRIAVAVGAVALGLAGGVLIVTSDHEATLDRLVVLLVAIGWMTIASGLVATARRPDTRFGWLLVAAGTAWMLVSLTSADSAWLFTAGLVLDSLWIGLLVHALLVYPDGRLPGAVAKLSAVAVYATVTVVQWFGLLWFVPGVELTPDCVTNRCPENLLLIRADHDLVVAASGIQNALGLLVGVGTLTVLVTRWRRASPALRTSLAPVAGAAVVVISGLVLMLIVGQTIGTSDIAATTVSLSLFGIVPLAFLAGVLRDRLSQGSVGPLVVELGTAHPTGVRDALARALHDPSLELAYWNATSGGYVDENGRAVVVTPTPGRATTMVEHAGERLAVLMHDPSLDENPTLVRSACAAAGIALANEQLQAALRRQLDELRASRARIVAAGDAERRRLERNLHDGAQQRLVALAMSVDLARTKLGGDAREAGRLLQHASEEAKAALEELRELARGIHPAVLDRGLEPAVNALIARVSVPVTFAYQLEQRLPQPVEAAAYYVVAEALTNIAKYAGASHATVSIASVAGGVLVDVRDDGVGGARMSDGSGLRGLQDRVEALDGALAIDSPSGGGTHVRATIPTPGETREGT
jgi:signal transduction histidine kinase